MKSDLDMPFGAGATKDDRVRRLIAWVVGGAAELSPGLLVRLALVLGALGGLAEALYLSIRQLIKHQPHVWYHHEIIWMAPLAAALFYAVPAAMLAGFARLGGSGVGIAKAVFLFTAPSLYALAQSRGIALHPAAGVSLSIGLATALGRAASRWPDSATRFIRRGAPVAAIGLVLLTIWGVTNLPRVVERRMLASLPAPRQGSANVVLIILDTVRAANLGLYGYHRPTTPNIDDWAAHGVVFDRAISTAPWTLPSHATLFTGHYNFAIGTAFTRPMDRRHATLAEVLGQHGYATAGFVANVSYASRMSGLHRGFARYEDFPVIPGMFVRSAWVPRGFTRLLEKVPGYPSRQVPKSAEYVTDEFLRWLEDRSDRPFFVFLNYFDAHDPYEAPPAFRGRFGPPPVHELDEDQEYTPEELAPWINGYDSCIAYIDDQLARVFERLERGGLRENTLVILTSDHGEMFGERGQIQHTSGLYMPVLHVPLAMVFPNGVPSAVRVVTPVTLRDLPATIMDLLGLAEDLPLPGQSLATLWTEGYPASTASPVLSEVDFGVDPAAWQRISRGRLKSLVDGTLHYIDKGDGIEELYDTVADPALENDLVGIMQFRPALDRFRETMESFFRSWESMADSGGKSR